MRLNKCSMGKSCKKGSLNHQVRYRLWKILSAVANLWSDIDTMEYFTYSVLQGIPTLSSYTLNDALLHFRGNISDFPNLEKCTVAVKITNGWGNQIIEEGAITALKAEVRVRE